MSGERGGCGTIEALRRPRDGQADQEVGVFRRRDLDVAQVVGEIRHHVQVSLTPKVVDEAEPRRQEVGIQVRRPQIGIERGFGIAEAGAENLRLPVKGGGTPAGLGGDA